MKKILLVMVMLFSISHAGLYSTISGMNMDEVKPKAEYTIDTAGINPRVYEFYPKNLKNTICIVIFASSANGNTMSMQCKKIAK